MKVSGFTFVRNAIKYDYPVVESIRSILPICDEVIVAVGHSEDDTRNLVLSIGDPKIRIIDTIWDDSLREGGKVLAVETDKAFAAISPDNAWAFYIQADEVIHEKYLPAIRAAMEKWESDPLVEGLVFNYTHFWGSYQYIGDSREWYRHEIRVIRNDKGIHSYLDAQGFRKDGRKLLVAPVNATVYHYGWVKPPQAQQAKLQTFHRYWHSDRWIDKTVTKSDSFDYSGMNFLSPFTGSHPLVMHDRIARQHWNFNPGKSNGKHTVKSAILHFIEKKTGWRVGEYRNFKIIR
ncbi:MAG: glycosyltransferase family 2 protein [Bacteroidota bacterium]